MRLHPIPLIAAVIPWLLHLATRTLARALNLPEPMVYGTGVFVLARVQAAENSIGRCAPGGTPHSLTGSECRRQLGVVSCW